MAATVVTSQRAASATPALSPSVGDLVVVFAYRDGSATAPTVPTGWTTALTQATSPSLVVAWRVWDGVWSFAAFTNATETHAIAIQNYAASPVGVTAGATGTSTTITWATVTLNVADGSSVLLRGCVDTRPDVVIPTSSAHTLDQSAGTRPGFITQHKTTTTSGASTTSTVSRSSAFSVGQVEILAGPIVLNATSAGSSSTTGNTRAVFVLTATSAGSSATSGDLSVTAGGAAVALAASSAGTSTDAGDLSVATAVAGSTAGSSTSSGDLSVAHSLGGTSAGSSTTSGALSVALSLASTSAGTSSTTGALSSSLALSGSSAGASSTSGASGVARPLAGTSAGSSSTTGDPTVALSLAGASSGASSTDGAMNLALALTGSSAGTSTTTGALGRTVGVAGVSAGGSFTAGVLSVLWALVGTTTGTSTTTGSLIALGNATLRIAAPSTAPARSVHASTPHVLTGTRGFAVRTKGS